MCVCVGGGGGGSRTANAWPNVSIHPVFVRVSWAEKQLAA